MAHYPNAPITEALIDIRVKNPDKLTIDELLKLHSKIADRYPTKQIRWALHAQVTTGTQISASSMQQAIGHQFVSQDGKEIVQARLDGFTFSRLQPYDRWETFSQEARRLWAVYRGTASPIAVTRLAVRYINRIDIPLPVEDLKDYLRTVPEISPEMAQGLARYFMQLQIPLDNLSAMLILNEAIIEPARAECISVVLDLDIARDWSPNDDEEMWAYFEHLRVQKNVTFEACITDQTRRLFN